MWLVTVLVVMLIPYVVLFLIDGLHNRPARDPSATSGADTMFTPTAEGAKRCKAESRLVGRLLGGEIDSAAYRDALAVLAAQDARSHPIRVPETPPG
jgi:hypothetical protein